MSSNGAKMLAYGALVVGLIVVLLKGKVAGQPPPTRRAVGATVLGSAAILLAGPAPQIAGPLAGILLADMLVVGNASTSVTAALGHVLAPGTSFAGQGVGPGSASPPGSGPGAPQPGTHPVA